MFVKISEEASEKMFNKYIEVVSSVVYIWSGICLSNPCTGSEGMINPAKLLESPISMLPRRLFS